MNNKANTDVKLSIMERIAYGMGDFSGNLVYSSISAFLLVYYVSVVGINSATAASVMAVSKLFDGVSDLLMGRIVDKTHTKWGKARPWIIRASIPLAICTILMFTVPAGLSGTLQIVYVFLTYNLVSTIFYTALNVPYATLQGLMTTSQYERGLLGNFRMLLATFGTMTVNTVVIKMVVFFGGSDTSQKGWTITYVVLMAVFLLFNFLTFWFCKERVLEEPAQTETNKAEEPSAIEGLKSLIKNKYWILIVVMMFVIYFMMSVFFGSNFYFAQYVVGNAGAYASLANAISMSQIGIMFLTPFIMKKIGTKMTALSGMVLSVIGFILTAVAGSNVSFLIVCNVIKGVGFGMGAATMFGMLQDAITYGQWLTNVKAMGMGNAASSFCMKVGSGIGTAALGFILGIGGFDTDPTSASAIASINMACIWIPIVTSVIGGLCIALFNLDKHYDKITADLAAGKWKGSSDN